MCFGYHEVPEFSNLLWRICHVF
ncbi:unnamed protein product [Ectocarpus sp. CCAP 1310/34]|nr:unnamed protein product [Ectocarpus sp. CCAP 1310/34]